MINNQIARFCMTAYEQNLPWPHMVFDNFFARSSITSGSAMITRGKSKLYSDRLMTISGPIPAGSPGVMAKGLIVIHYSRRYSTYASSLISCNQVSIASLDLR